MRLVRVGATHTRGMDLGEECIHGFEVEFCATCSPAPTFEAPVVKKARPASRPTSLRAPAPSRSAQPAVIVGDQRIYHITHIGNLAAIVARGSMLPDHAEEHDEAVGVFSHDGRADREATRVPGRDSSVADHVPFVLTPHASVWESIRAGIEDPRLADGAAGAAPAAFVILATASSSRMATPPALSRASPPPTMTRSACSAACCRTMMPTPCRTLRCWCRSPIRSPRSPSSASRTTRSASRCGRSSEERLTRRASPCPRLGPRPLARAPPSRRDGKRGGPTGCIRPSPVVLPR